jgi:hypothetical protein
MISSKEHESIQGSARFVNPGLGAKLLVTYPTSFVTESMSTDGNFWIIETDYKNYAIVFLCLPIGPNISFRMLALFYQLFLFKTIVSIIFSYFIYNTEFLSYLSRERFPFTMGLNFVHQRIETLGLDRTLLKPIDQTNCPSKAEK